MEIGQRGHHHGLGPCEAINIPTENGSSDEKDHAITSESQEESWDKDIRTVETVKTESGNESPSERKERNDLPGKKESKSGDSQLRDQEDPEGLMSREDYLPERWENSHSQKVKSESCQPKTKKFHRIQKSRVHYKYFDPATKSVRGRSPQDTALQLLERRSGLTRL